LPTHDAVDLEAAYAYPTDRPWLRANMVASIDGAAADAEGRSAGLSGPADKRVFRVLRGLSDGVLVGAGTVRQEGYRAARPRPEYAQQRADAGQGPAPALVIVSGGLDLDLAGPLFDGAVRSIIVTTDAAAQRVPAAADVADVLVAGTDRVDLAVALAALHERGLTRLLCEGGPSLLAQVAAAGLLDELCLTVAPRLVGGEAPRVLAGLPVALGAELSQLLEEDGFLFSRYLVGRSTAPTR
jgi:riboflavin-specific deaminase-like protein